MFYSHCVKRTLQTANHTPFPMIKVDFDISLHALRFAWVCHDANNVFGIQVIN